jgi:hypothetical protein
MRWVYIYVYGMDVCWQAASVAVSGATVQAAGHRVESVESSIVACRVSAHIWQLFCSISNHSLVLFLKMVLVVGNFFRGADGAVVLVSSRRHSSTARHIPCR